jgi:hypothetical protein
MTSSADGVTPDPTDAATDDAEVLAPATPGAEALPLPEEAADKPSEE